MNTQIGYLYRDADNYKQYHEEVLEGEITPEQKRMIADCLDDGEYFIPHQVGLPEVRFDTVTESDHPWFELDSETGFTLTSEPPTVNITVDELVSRFQAAKGCWDDESYSDYASAMLGETEHNDNDAEPYTIIAMDEPGVFFVNTTTTSYIVHVPAERGYDASAVMMDLCRAIVKIERGGSIVTSVQKVYPDGHRPRVAFRQSKEYKAAKKELVPMFANAYYITRWESGAKFKAPCKVNLTTREIFDVQDVGSPNNDDDCLAEAVEIGGVEHEAVNIDELIELNVENLEERLEEAQNNETVYWLSESGRQLADEIVKRQ